MELGSLEVQIFVSLVVVLGTAFIALVCDFLKGNNEQLRERNVELRTRQDERERLGLGQPMSWLQGLAALVQRAAPAAHTPTQSEVPAPAPAPVAEPVGTTAAPPPFPDATPVDWAPPQPAPADSIATPDPPMRRRLYDEVRPTANGGTWASKEELEQLAGRAARIRARHEAGQQPPPESVDAAPPPVPKPAPEPVAEPMPATTNRIHILSVPPSPEVLPSADEPPSLSESEPDAFPPAETGAAAEPVAESHPDLEPVWEPEPEVASLDAAEPEPDIEYVSAEPLPVAGETTEPRPAPKASLLGGFHEGAVLSRILEENQAFSGVAVSIGINDFEALRERLTAAGDAGEALMPVQKLIESMLRPEDFASRFADDEYVLLFPGECGSTAQRRLFQVSEKLWDFQLRSLGQLAVMFSWGGLEVSNDSLSSAVAAARERMYQTRRNRRQSPLDRKRVVNA